jgi:alkylhydroperoxidase family enzyme
MPRVREVPRAEAAPEVLPMYQRLFQDRDPVAQPGTATGTRGDWWTVMALVPDLLTVGTQQFAAMSSPKRVLPQRLRELALVRTGFAVGSKFVFSQHCKGARSAGLSDAQVADIPSWTTSDLFSPEERAVLAYADEMTLSHGRVQDVTFARLRQHLSEEAVVELTWSIGIYCMHAIMARALRLEYDDVDERLVEVPAPGATTSSSDIMAAIRSET